MKERRPEFTVIAGPNGAGKSRLCSFYIRTTSFDGDKFMLKLRNEHPEWPDRWISGSVAGELERQKTSALENRTDFAFETNFSSEMVVNMINEFKEAGFKISLCYFGLYSEEDSVSRVMHRAQTGGHDVTNDVIRFNFREGLRNAQHNLRLFDNITFVDGNSDYGHIVALHIANGNIHEVEDNPPQWFKEQFEEAFSNII
ncbi:MAG: zeta toxin family protein [Bacteroidales bacterium]|nr:zeta toxin family protein [Bacteroidales bacterium]